jgi:hypothetical protein
MNRKNEQPEWTAFNERDPGIPLVELLAFLGSSFFAGRAWISARNGRNFADSRNSSGGPVGRITCVVDSGTVFATPANK